MKRLIIAAMLVPVVASAAPIQYAPLHPSQLFMSLQFQVMKDDANQKTKIKNCSVGYFEKLFNPSRAKKEEKSCERKEVVDLLEKRYPGLISYSTLWPVHRIYPHGPNIKPFLKLNKIAPNINAHDFHEFDIAVKNASYLHCGVRSGLVITSNQKYCVFSWMDFLSEPDGLPQQNLPTHKVPTLHSLSVRLPMPKNFVNKGLPKTCDSTYAKNYFHEIFHKYEERSTHTYVYRGLESTQNLTDVPGRIKCIVEANTPYGFAPNIVWAGSYHYFTIQNKGNGRVLYWSSNS